MSTSPFRRGSRSPAKSGGTNREQIVEAALRAVRRQGPGVSMTSIAAEAGVTKPIVYRTVGDKEAVAVAVAEHLSRDVDAVMRAAMRGPGERHERIRAANRAFFDLLDAERNLFLFVEYGWGSHDGMQLEAMIERSALLLVPVLDAALGPSAEGRSAVAQTWAYGAVGALRTMAVMWVRSPHCDIDRVVDDATSFVEAILDGAANSSGVTESYEDDDTL